MKKKLVAVLATGLLTFGMIGMAQAATFTYSWDPIDILLPGPGAMVPWHVDVTSEIKNNTITSAILEVYLKDDNPFPYQMAEIQISGSVLPPAPPPPLLPLPFTQTIVSWQMSDYTAVLVNDNHILANLQNSGMFDVLVSWDVINPTTGMPEPKPSFYADSFYFDKVKLTVTGDPVPVPGAVWLLGSGFAGLVGLRRKKNKK